MYLPAFLLLLGVTASSCTTTPSTTTTTTATTSDRTTPDWQSESCRYYCIYRRPYCCDDGSLPVPRDHEVHSTLDCPPENDQICKSTGIFLNGTVPAMVLAKGDPKKQVWCASDGYCREDQRCCPSPCVRRHLCMAGLGRELPQEILLPELEVEEEEELYLPEE
ncbi:hypothetical protein O3P69_016504 [Scylla paramamosain]|uniref:WAP domain-containing protein n=1 Tax=Scylla paramamosain TaxID=85552 RepID=A0AAW0TE89_SCYPA